MIARNRIEALVHKGMRLTEADLNALVEDIQLAMDEVGILYRTQNRLLACGPI
jgi:hemoglobin